MIKVVMKASVFTLVVCWGVLAAENMDEPNFSSAADIGEKNNISDPEEKYEKTSFSQMRSKPMSVVQTQSLTAEKGKTKMSFQPGELYVPFMPQALEPLVAGIVASVGGETALASLATGINMAAPWAPAVITGLAVMGAVDMLWNIHAAHEAAAHKMQAAANKMQEVINAKLRFYLALQNADDQIWKILADTCDMPVEIADLPAQIATFRGSVKELLDQTQGAMRAIHQSFSQIPDDSEMFENLYYLDAAERQLREAESSLDAFKTCVKKHGKPCDPVEMASWTGKFQTQCCEAEHSVMHVITTEFPPDDTIRMFLDKSRCMDVSDANFVAGAHVILWPCKIEDRGNQQWVAGKDGRIRPKHGHPDLCLDIEEPELLKLQKCVDWRAEYQQFQLNVATKKIRPIHKKKECLTISSGAKPRHFKIADCVEQQQDFELFHNQLFQIFLPLTPPETCAVSTNLKQALMPNSSAEFLKMAAQADEKSCRTAVRLRTRQHVNSGPVVLMSQDVSEDITDVRKEEEGFNAGNVSMTSVASFVMNMVHALCFNNITSEPNWYDFQSKHIQKPLSSIEQTAPLRLVSLIGEIQEKATELAADMDSNQTSAAYMPACLMTLATLEAMGKKNGLHVACVHMQSAAECQKNLLPELQRQLNLQHEFTWEFLIWRHWLLTIGLALGLPLMLCAACGAWRRWQTTRVPTFTDATTPLSKAAAPVAEAAAAEAA